jgi:transcriptional regulator with XRE-family HTH domain
MVFPSQIDPREHAIVQALKMERERQGISAAHLARKIGIGRNTIPNLERNESRPTLWVLLKIADGLNVRLKDYLD